MVFNLRDAGGRFAVSLTPRSVTASRDGREVAAYDHGGRLYSFFRDPDTFRRGLSGRILHKRHDEKGRLREWLSSEQNDGVVDAAADLAAATLGALRRAHRLEGGGSPVGGGIPATLDATLSLASGFRREQARADAERFSRVYSPIGILPPDQYLALVLQATAGCSFATCTFCDLYREPYRVRTPVEFREHIAAVRQYLGPSITLRERSIFLGAANALAIPMERLAALFRVLREEFASGPPVHAFVDAFTGVRKSAAEYAALQGLGLARVYIGLESGHDPLLAFVRKPGSATQALDTVRALHAGGVHVGVIVVVGLGGDRYADGHVRDTGAVLNAMGLGEGDLIYLSDLVEVSETSYPALARAAGIRPLDAASRRAQRDRLRAGLTFAGRPPRIATYDIREFVY